MAAGQDADQWPGYWPWLDIRHQVSQTLQYLPKTVEKMYHILKASTGTQLGCHDTCALLLACVENWNPTALDCRCPELLIALLKLDAFVAVYTYPLWVAKAPHLSQRSLERC